jgi:hypothetical protein
MTRKDYVLLAAAIVATQDRIKTLSSNRIGDAELQLRGVRRAAAHICDALAKDNPAFMPGVFLHNCGYGPTTMNPRDPALDLRPLPGEEAVTAAQTLSPKALLEAAQHGAELGVCDED